MTNLFVGAEARLSSTLINPESLIPLTPAVFHILLALADGKKHGYAIMQQVTHESGGQVTMSPGTLYGSVKRMIDSALIRETHERPTCDDDARRRYYTLTELGRKVLRAESTRLSQAVAVARDKRLIDHPSGN